MADWATISSLATADGTLALAGATYGAVRSARGRRRVGSALPAARVGDRRRFLLDLLYTDQVGGQRTISRFGLLPGGDGWLTAAARHWYLDAPAPR